MKTPDWSQAPEWANYVAMDENGAWFWFSEKPRAGVEEWVNHAAQYEMAVAAPDWTACLVKRPSQEETS